MKKSIINGMIVTGVIALIAIPAIKQEAEAQTLSCIQSSSTCVVETLFCQNGVCWTDDFAFQDMKPYRNIPDN